MSAPASKAPNPWHYKPWWCQPWSIVLSGCVAISGSWLLFKVVWITAFIAVPVLLWMGFFTIVWPSLMRQSGMLDAYSQSVDDVSE